jgi:DNA polymerase-3 subunit alpha
MGKKKPEEMAKLKTGFVEGCVKNGVEENEGIKVFEILEKFAEYGFNVSHSISYSIISYQTAWLKNYYPVEFLAAYFTEEMGKAEETLPILNNCIEKGIKVLAPDVNKSGYEFKPEGTGIRFGLGGIKGLGESVEESIVEAREDGEFRDIFDFCNRVKPNKKVLEALLRAGALDSIMERKNGNE